MKLTKGIKFILLLSAVLVLSACHKRQPNPSDVNDANQAYSSDATASGLGHESGFGDEAGGGSSSQQVAKRIYYFDFDSTMVRSDDRSAIAANANYLMSHPNVRVLLEGHTDPRGSREYNIGLGERRAKAVADVLTARGVNPAQIRIVSYGAEKLASYGHSEAAYQQDRRVALVYLRR